MWLVSRYIRKTAAKLQHFFETTKFGYAIRGKTAQSEMQKSVNRYWQLLCIPFVKIVLTNLTHSFVPQNSMSFG